MSPVWIGFCCGVVVALPLGAVLMLVILWLLDRAGAKRPSPFFVDEHGAARRGKMQTLADIRARRDALAPNWKRGRK